MLTGSEYDLAQRHHALFANGLANDCESLLTDLAVGHDVVGITQIKFVDLAARHEFIDIDDAFAFDRDRLEFVRLKLDVFAFRDLVTLYDLGIIHFVAGFGVNFLVPDTMARLFVDLVKADLFPLGRSRKQCDRA